MTTLVSTLCVISSAVLAAGPGPQSYILRVAAAVEQVGAESKSMDQSAQEAATRLVKGGKLWAAGNPAFVSELCGRAGGLMYIQGLRDGAPDAGDVVMYGLAGAPPISDTLAKSRAHIVAFDDDVTSGASATFSGYAATNNISPTLASVIPAWVYTGVLIKACEARGKMPVTFETIGLPGGFPRIQQYQAKGVFWIDHRKSGWPETAPYAFGAQYARKVVEILRRVQKEDREKLDRAGDWAARALHDGKTVYMYSMGHFVPDEIAKSEIGTKFKTATWNSGFATFVPPDDKYTIGDLVIHIGYQHPPNGLYERARPSGANIVYVDLLEHRDWKSDPHAIWIDPMWPWDDAVVTLEGYDIPMLPPSGIVNSAIAWEIYRLATQ
jgi:hypothetical protein